VTRPWKTVFVLAAATASTLSGACAPTTTELTVRPRPEDVWLGHIGTGPRQTRRVCDRSPRDRVGLALCNPSTPPIYGLEDLYRAIRLGEGQPRMVAATTHSLGLSARSVSTLNPRAFVFEDTNASSGPITPERIVATSFARGEQFVELVGQDPTTYDYNFYLLRFEQECNRSRCTPEDLLSARLESGWTDWTLYADRDLVDTPLDCLSCHQPYGTASYKFLLMRQLIDPWMHWGDFRGGNEHDLCPIQPPDGAPGKVVVTADGLDVLLALEGTSGRYAGVPVSELHAAKSGQAFAELLNDAGQILALGPHPEAPSEQLYFQTREVVCERFNDGASKTWNEERSVFLSRGLPTPYYGPDVTAPNLRAEVLADRLGFLRRHADEDALDVAMTFIGRDVATDIGFFPRETDSAPEILRAMCIRCHAGDTDPGLRRARFNATSFEHIDPKAFREIVRRLLLPRDSPELMPPVRAGELPRSAIAKVVTYLRDHCAKPNACY